MIGFYLRIAKSKTATGAPSDLSDPSASMNLILQDSGAKDINNRHKSQDKTYIRGGPSDVDLALTSVKPTICIHSFGASIQIIKKH